jgi:hypothetical protein
LHLSHALGFALGKQNSGTANFLQWVSQFIQQKKKEIPPPPKKNIRGLQGNKYILSVFCKEYEGIFLLNQ